MEARTVVLQHSQREKIALEMRNGTTWVFDKRLISKSDKCRVLLQTTFADIETWSGLKWKKREILAMCI